METAQQLCDRLRDKGYSITPQRRAIFEALEGAHHHPSAEQVHEEVRRRMPDVSLATVYKTLKELVSLGEVQELNFHGDRSRFDPKTCAHSHLKCLHCGRLDDVESCYDDIKPPRRTGWQLQKHEVVFYGTCPDCK